MGAGGGGICGKDAGYEGECVVSNCYSTGIIGPSGGGICGQYAGSTAWNGDLGSCSVIMCISQDGSGIGTGISDGTSSMDGSNNNAWYSDGSWNDTHATNTIGTNASAIPRTRWCTFNPAFRFK